MTETNLPEFIFILGAPRSGTTLILNMLIRQQDKITGSHIESGLYSKYTKSRFAHNTFLNSSYFKSFLSATEIKNIFRESKNSIDFFKAAAKLHCQNTNKSFFVEKTPSHTLYWKNINKDFDSPRVILLKRTPAAVIHSMTTAAWSRLLSDKLPSPINEATFFRYLAAILKFYKYIVHQGRICDFSNRWKSGFKSVHSFS